RNSYLPSITKRRSSDLSRDREKTIRDEQQHSTNPYQAFRVMNDPAYDIFSYKYDAAAGTLHTAVYFPEEMKAWFAIGADRPPLRSEEHTSELHSRFDLV